MANDSAQYDKVAAKRSLAARSDEIPDLVQPWQASLSAKERKQKSIYNQLRQLKVLTYLGIPRQTTFKNPFLEGLTFPSAIVELLN